MKKLISIFLGTLLLFQLGAQIFNPINWKTESILWSTYSRYPVIGPSGLEPRMRIDYHNLPIFHDGNLYQVLNNFNSNYSGYFVQKIDLISGQEKWQNIRIFESANTNGPLRQYAVSPYVRNGKFGFHIFKENRISNSSVWGRAIIGQAEYNASNGDSTLYYISSIDDPLNRRLFNGIPGLGRHTFMDQKEDMKDYILIYRKCPLECKKLLMGKYTLDKQGHSIDSIVNEIELKLDIIRSQVYKIQDDNYLVLLETQDPTNEAIYEIRTLLVDKEMNVSENNDITKLIDPYDSLEWLTFRHYGITNDKYNLYALRKLDSTTVIYTLDTKGKLWETIELPAAYTALSISLPMPDGIGSVVAISDYSDTDSSTLKIYQSDGQGNLTLKKELVTDNPDDKFGINAMYWTPDNNLLLYINQIHVSQIPLFVRQDYYCNALLDTRKIGIITSVDNTDKSTVGFLYPNPVKDILTIPDLQKEMISYQIYDLIGRRVMSSKEIYNQQIDVSSLNQGFYHLLVKDKNKNFTYRFIKQ